MDYFIHLAILISIYSILGVSLNLVMGYTGLLSVAHAAFYGIGAYTAALLMKFWGR
jgi:branched-chain amino acid transport system permease protein